ncbi:MAG: chromosome condensation regulator RCC1 [Deltaproteobacteria bacterium]|nr:chromosome condensation regulator RCC1 [Deltaproteobacteria bacterium]
MACGYRTLLLLGMGLSFTGCVRAGFSGIPSQADGSTQDANTQDANTEDAIPGGAVAVAGGAAHTCALMSGGRVFCWGENANGQLGNDSTTPEPAPVAVLGLEDAVQISLGRLHSCALRATGRVVCWGGNSFGALGDGTGAEAHVPVEVNLQNVAAVSAGRYHTCAMLSSGGVRCWGLNDDGQLGNDSTENTRSPVTVALMDDAKAISAAAVHSCALRATGKVVCWGSNSSGRLGDGSALAHSLVPVEVVGLSDVSLLAANRNHTCAVVDGGRVFCWGANPFGQLGDGTIIPHTTPVLVTSLNQTLGLAVRTWDHCVALRVGGEVVAWGRNDYGQLGDGTFEERHSPVVATGSLNAVAIGAGHQHSCLITRLGAVYCWGKNGSGQLGDGTIINSPLPLHVAFQP